MLKIIEILYFSEHKIVETSFSEETKICRKIFDRDRLKLLIITTLISYNLSNSGKNSIETKMIKVFIAENEEHLILK